MGGRVSCSLVFFLLGIFLSSGASVTKRPPNGPARQLHHGIKTTQITSLSSSQKDITAPTTTIPTITPVTPTSSPPTLNPNSDPDYVTPATATPMETPSTTMSPVTPGASWCVASQSAPPAALQVALDYACGYGGTDCTAIQPGGLCYNPNTLRDHASYAFNSYYQKTPIPNSCNFGGTAVTTSTNPSTGTCQYPSTSTSSSILNTTNSNGATVFGAVPSTPAVPSTAVKIYVSPRVMYVTCLIVALLAQHHPPGPWPNVRRHFCSNWPFLFSISFLEAEMRSLHAKTPREKEHVCM